MKNLVPVGVEVGSQQANDFVFLLPLISCERESNVVYEWRIEFNRTVVGCNSADAFPLVRLCPVVTLTVEMLSLG